MCVAAKATRSCPLWVISRQTRSEIRCPLYPRKRTSSDTSGMSALCQKRTNAPQQNDVRHTVIVALSHRNISGPGRRVAVSPRSGPINLGSIAGKGRPSHQKRPAHVRFGPGANITAYLTMSADNSPSSKTNPPVLAASAWPKSHKWSTNPALRYNAVSPRDGGLSGSWIAKWWQPPNAPG